MQSNYQKAQQIYRFFLSFYPPQFKKRYGEEMLQTFHDMYQEKQTTEFTFWCKLSTDTLTSALHQHISLAQRQGIKKYGKEILHITSYNIVGGFLLLPFFLALLADAISRVLQGNLSYPNPIVYEKLSHTIFFNPPAIFLWAIVFPLSAGVLNTLSLVPQIQKYHGRVLNLRFIKTTIPTLLVIAIGVGFFILIIGHDFIPCMANNMLSHGFNNFPQTLQVCRRV